MLMRTLIGFGLLLMGGSCVWGQCGCGDSSCSTLAIGSDYTTVDDSERWSGFGSSTNKFNCFGTCDRDCSALRRCRYASIFGGWNGGEDFKITRDVPDGEDFNMASIEDGEIYGVAIGSQVHPQFRYELETTYREDDPESWSVLQFTDGSVTSSDVQPATGELQTYTGMVNFMLDFKPRKVGCWQGYAGIGIGGANFNGEFITGTNTYEIDDSSLAWQVIGGVSRAVTQRLDAYVEYRYFSAANVNVFDATNSISLGDFQVEFSSVLGGLRVRF